MLLGTAPDAPTMARDALIEYHVQQGEVRWIRKLGQWLRVLFSFLSRQLVLDSLAKNASSISTTGQMNVSRRMLSV